MTKTSRLLLENSIKTVLMLAVLVLADSWIRDSITKLPANQQGNVLTALGLLLAGCVAGTFAFSYERTNLDSLVDRYLGHATTFTLNLAIGLLLQITVYALGITPGFFNDPIVGTALLVYLSIVLYDFWDLLRCVRDNQ